jgi:hypothetical protein
MSVETRLGLNYASRRVDLGILEKFSRDPLSTEAFPVALKQVGLPFDAYLSRFAVVSPETSLLLDDTDVPSP